MKSSRIPKTKDCRVEGYDDEDGSAPASINGNLEILIGSVDFVASSSSTEGSTKSGLSIWISANESSTVIQRGAGGNSLGEKRKSFSLNGSISRHKSSPLLPILFTTPSSRQGRNKEQQVQQQQHQPAIMYLRDLMFNSNLLGPIPKLEKGGKICKNKAEDDNSLMVEGIISACEETDLFYDEEAAICMLPSKDASNSNGNQDQEGRKKIVRFALDQGSSPELIEADQRLLAKSIQGPLCTLNIYNESDGDPYGNEKYSGNCSANINNFYRNMLDDKDEASSCEYYSDKDEDSGSPQNKIVRGMFYSLGGMAFAGATASVTKLFSSVRKSKDDNFGGGEVISQGTQNTVDTVHLVESSTSMAQSSSSVLNTSSGMLQSSALNSGASSGASSTSISSSLATSSASGSAASSAGASASSTTASTISTSTASASASSAASLAASSTASTVTSTAASTTASTAVSTAASSTMSAASMAASASSASLASGASTVLSATSAASATSAISASVSTAVITQTVAVAAQ